jgi:hypothetical protein
MVTPAYPLPAASRPPGRLGPVSLRHPKRSALYGPDRSENDECARRVVPAR